MGYIVSIIRPFQDLKNLYLNLVDNVLCYKSLVFLSSLKNKYKEHMNLKFFSLREKTTFRPIIVVGNGKMLVNRFGPNSYSVGTQQSWKRVVWGLNMVSEHPPRVLSQNLRAKGEELLEKSRRKGTGVQPVTEIVGEGRRAWFAAC